jgi:excisionase family DNA binding protein
MNQPESPRLYSVKETAQQLSLSIPMVWKLLGQRRIPFIKIGASTRIPADAIAQIAAHGLPSPRLTPELSQ